MTQRTGEAIRSEAIAWHIRLREGAPEDWESFAQWLDRDPAHSDAFDIVAAADAAIVPEAVPLRGMPAPSNDGWEAPPVERRRSGRYWASGLAAVAALFLVGMLTISWLAGQPDLYEVATASGQRRTVDIGGGSSAMLNGDTRLILDRNDPRFAELKAGEATFAIRHDPDHPFAVAAGERRIEDVGTRFNLIHDRARGRFEVAVIEGAVVFQEGATRVPLAAGQALVVRDGGPPRVSSDDPTHFAGWQTGRLNFNATPLDAVASDLARAVGAEVRVDPAIGALPFTGSIRIEDDHAATITNFAATLGLQARRAGTGWLIEPNGRAPH